MCTVCPGKVLKSFHWLLQAVLSRWTRQDDIVVGSPTLGRNRPELEHLVGYFVNMLALRQKLSGSQTFTEVVKGARATMLDALAHSDVPFPKVVEALDVARDPSRTPLYQALLSLKEGAALSGSQGESDHPLEFLLDHSEVPFILLPACV